MGLDRGTGDMAYLERLRLLMPQVAPEPVSTPEATSSITALTTDLTSLVAVPGASEPTQSVRPGSRAGTPARLEALQEFAGRHVKVVSALALVSVIVAVWAIMSARSVPVDDAVAPPVITTPVAGDPASAAAPVWWNVHVLGAVNRPGVVVIPAESRVIDAIEAAGGFTGQADSAQLNLAARLDDGFQVIIGTVTHPQGEVRAGVGGEAAPAGVTEQSAGLVNLNTATAAQLMTLPGVGEVTATAILAWRSKNGRFTDSAQLQEVSGIGPKTLAQIAPYVCV